MPGLLFLSLLAACRKMLSFLRLHLGTRLGRLGLPAQLEAKPQKCRSQVRPGSESGLNLAYLEILYRVSVASPVSVLSAVGHSEERVMARGFGVKSQRSGKRKSVLREVKSLAAPLPRVEPAFVDELMSVDELICSGEEAALAWSIGVFNPLGGVDLLAAGARFLEPEEEDWVSQAIEIGWLEGDDVMDPLYFTAPPPDFALAEADWYVRPDLSSWLESPEPLRQVVQQYPIPEALLWQALDDRFNQLGWTPEQIDQFTWQEAEKVRREVTIDEVHWLLLRLRDL
jgi:hypothetical protein